MDLPLELVERCRAGDRRAFEELVRETHGAVYGLALRILGDREEAEDVTQEVYLRVWRGIKGFRGDSSFGTWLYRVAANVALNALKARRRLGGIAAQLPEESWEEEGKVLAKLEAERLESLISRLPPSQRAVLVLRDIYDLGGEEVARMLGISPGAVKVRLFRARQRLRELAGGEGGGG